MQPPTVGRIVHYHNTASGEAGRAGIICHVHENGLVNLSVFNEDGTNVPIQNVPLVDVNPRAGHSPGLLQLAQYCCWPPKVEGEVHKAAKRGFEGE